MNPAFDLSNLKTHPIIAVALSVVLVLLPGCAARMAQQEIDTLKEHAIAIQQASEFMRLDRLKRNSKCRGAHETFAKLILAPLETEYRSSGPKLPDSQLQPVLDYIRHASIVQKYMDERKVTAETALTVMGDLVLPPALPPEIDPFNGCFLHLGRRLDKPATYQGGKLADNFIFYWQSRDWREDVQAGLNIWDKLLPPEKRTPFVRFLLDYSLALALTLNERQENSEITLLQAIKAGNAAGQYLFEQAKQYGAQLRDNLIRAKAQDDALLTTVAVGLGAVATAALVVASMDANYRIANAQTAMARAIQLQALQAPAPIQYNYTLPGRYGTQGYIYCR
jgi:hypothetical protein